MRRTHILPGLRARTLPGLRARTLPWSTAMVAVVLLVGLVPSAYAAPVIGRVSVTDLRVDQVAEPLGIDNPQPRLSWQLRSSVHAERQTAYQVLVASDPELLRPAVADIWDSGRVASADSVDVSWGGPALESATRYHWTVRVWDSRGKESKWSPAAWWETALLSQSDWGDAQWISPSSEGGPPSWTDYTVESDFVIDRGAAGFVFRAQSPSDFYMWQINTIFGNSVLLRPQVQQGGSWRILEQIPLDDVIPMDEAHSPHRISITVSGQNITTRIDGNLVDTTTDSTFSRGVIGFRSGDNQEHSRYDNVVVKGSDGEVWFADDFATIPDPSFPHARIENGMLSTANGDLQMTAAQPEAPLLRKDFTLGQEVASARAYVYGLGWYELRLSGEKVGDRVLAPAATPYAGRSLYQTYDVTDQVRAGDNTIGLWLAEGYGPTYSQYGWRWFGPRQAIVKLDVAFTDGTTQSVVSDPSWTWADRTITSAHIYHGEAYDARLEHDGWDAPGFDAGDWQQVRQVSAPSQRLVADTAPPIRVVDTLRPVGIAEPEPGVYVFDLGQNIAGWARLHVEGERGTAVWLHFAEAIHDDGSLDTFTNRAAEATDTYVLEGAGETETYEPRFTYHGFRYVEVRGLAGLPTVDTLEGRVVLADVDDMATFTSSDGLIDQIYANNRWTMLNNSMSFPTDTPVRDERTPPGMDVQVYQDASTRDLGMGRFYAKYLDDMVPPGMGGSPEMSGMPVTLAWTLYEQYGDVATLARHYDNLAAYVSSLAEQAPAGIWPESNGFGDWCPPVPAEAANGGLGGPNVGGYGHCASEVSLVNTALYYRQAQVMSRAATVLGHAEDAACFSALAERVKAAFNGHFLDETTGVYGSGRQTTSVLPLALGMVPDEHRQAVGTQLVRTVLEKDDGHLDTGIFGTRYLVDALVEAGRPDVALTVLQQRTYPGYGYQIGLGATTAWEEWTYRSAMHTYDHAMMAGINASFITEFGGIEPVVPAYEKVRIKPAVPSGLTNVEAAIDTVRGTVSSSWSIAGRLLKLDVTIPVNATAEVWVPIHGGSADGFDVHASHGLELDRVEDGFAVFEAGSGTYHFRSR